MFFACLLGKCKRETCKYRHLNDLEKPYEQEKHTNKIMPKINNRKLEDRNCCQISFEHKHCRSDYDDCGCECKRRRMRNHSPEINTRNCDSSDTRKLWVCPSAFYFILFCSMVDILRPVKD